MDQLRKIFNGEYSNWNQVGGKDERILVATRAVPETGSGVECQRILLKGSSYAKGHQVMRTFRDMANSCRNSSAIGYIPTTSHYFNDVPGRGVKAIAVKAGDNEAPRLPAPGMVGETNYPITIPLDLYWNAKDESPCIAPFPAFCEREKGKIRHAAN